MGVLTWVADPGPARWDEAKARIIGAEAPGVFDTRYAGLSLGDIVPGRWFRAESGDEVVGFGWMDVNWGDAEILLATAPPHRGRGVGSFVLEQLRDEAQARGLRYVTNVVRPTHPESKRVIQWLEKRGFRAGEDGRHFRAVSRPSVPPPPA
ncbi:MAG: GNAT family N-acetyltransferase [Myxococcota bacterium]